MLTAILSINLFALGILVGYFLREYINKFNTLIEIRKERKEAQNIGVVRPQGIPATRNQPIDLSSDTGPVMRPTPAKVEDQRQDERARILRENHR
jgi:hypothetical protein